MQVEGGGWRWPAVAGCRAGGTKCVSACKGPCEEVTIIFTTSTIVWSQVKQEGGNKASPIKRKLN